MADLIFVVVIFAFFALAVLLVGACDRIIGPDPAPADATGATGATGATEGTEASDRTNPVDTSAREVVRS
jgi:hypothetical protein